MLTAAVHKLIEHSTYKADVTFLFCVYAFVRGCTLIDESIDFEHFVDLYHGKKFKQIRPGNAVRSSYIGGSVTSTTNILPPTITPEVFILQVDLLTSCTVSPSPTTITGGNISASNSMIEVQASSEAVEIEEQK